MTDPELPLYANRPLTPRQDRIEATIERVLRAGGTRSELREAVHEFADHARMQQIPPERAIANIKAVAMRAASVGGRRRDGRRRFARRADGDDRPVVHGALLPGGLTRRPRRRRRGQAAGAAGRMTLIVVPRPGALVASTRPPCASTRCRTIARPSPVPPCSRERPGSAR